MENTTISYENLDFTSLCRTCLCNRKLKTIFETPGEHITYSNTLLIIAGVKIEMDDGLPQKMCTDCINTLNNSLQFRRQCKNAEKQLLKLKRQLKCSNITIQSNNVKTDIAKEIISDAKDAVGGEIKDGDYYYEFLDDDDDDKPLKCFIDVPHNVSETLNNVCENNNEVVIVKPEVEKESMKKHNRKVRVICDKDPPYQAVNSADCKTQRVSCKICLKELSIRSIDSHMARLHPGADERKLKCELCDHYVFADKLNRHVLMMHGHKGLRCAYCKIEYESREQLVDHVTACTAKKKKRKISEAGRQMSECDVCHKKMQKSSLRMHKAIKHAGLGPVCEHCGKKFGNKFRLSEHYRAKHGYDKFRCSYCDFQSAGVMSMRNHERRHRGEKPFVCSQCGARFHAAYLLAQHKHSHRTEKLVKCDRCPARFKARNGLHAHRLARHAAGRRRDTPAA